MAEKIANKISSQNSNTIHITGTTPSTTGSYASWNNLNGYDLSDKWLVNMFVETDGVMYNISQGTIGAVGMYSTNHLPLLFVGDTADSMWLNKTCHAFYQ